MNSNNPIKPIKSYNNFNNDEGIPVESTFQKPVNEHERAWADKLFAEAMLNYGNRRDLDKTIQLLEELISFSPDYVDAYYNLGICYSEKRQTDKAIEFFRKAIQIDSNPKSETNQSARFNLGNQLVRKEQFREAVEQFENILKTSPKTLDALYNAGFVYFKYLQDYDKAIGHFELILKIFNLHMDAWYNLGLCHLLKGDKEKALEVWERLVQVNPSYVPAFYNLAVVNKELGRKDKAMLFFQKYLDIPVKDPSQYRYARHAARVLKRLQEENKKA